MSPPVNKFESDNLRKHFVATALIVRDDRILLIHHKKIGLWLPPGGHIEAEEDPVAALRREICEETGLEIEILSDSVDPRASDETVQVLPLPHHIQVERIADGPHEHIDLVYLCQVRPGEGPGERGVSGDQVVQPRGSRIARYRGEREILRTAGYR